MSEFKDKVVYQIWPRSFLDSNGDGIGDLGGIIKQLDYLADLGIDLIWLSPIYATSNKDYGYDIDDYYQINPEYGTMDDFDKLIIEAKKRKIGILMDLVANHTSDQHEWFKKAISDIHSPYRDYYFFKDGRKDPKNPNKTLPPNNWLSAFGGSAWQYDTVSKQYYLTMFTPNQCDLNWDNENVRKGIYDIMRFWLDKGIAGFRMDVINTICKAKDLPNVGTSEKLDFPFEYIVSLPKSHEYIKEMNQEVISKYDCFTVGEGMATPATELNRYTNPNNHELDMMFQFDLHLIGCGPLGKYDFRKLYRWNIPEFKKIVERWQLEVLEGGGWLGNYMSNHDQPRCVSRFGDEKHYRVESAKALALLNFTLRGTPFIYQGEEIGMTNCKFREEEWKDYEAINDYKVLQTMMHLPKFIARPIIQKMTRDHARTPVQWNGGEYAGFSTVTPWIKLNPNYTSINVAADLASENSIIQFYKDLIALRKQEKTLNYGTYKPVLQNHKKVLGFLREYEEDCLLIMINLSAQTTNVDILKFTKKSTTLNPLLGTYTDSPLNDKLTLRPFEGRVYRINYK